MIFVVTAVVRLYPNILHDVGLKALKQALDKKEQEKNPKRRSFKYGRICFEK